ncbi:polyprenyl synthetase family protein [Sphingobacterium daejeonense]|uniref:polyprenyl synthetase family protein n=1 Tax=Sphingobacterium daejeonense TaxID=371142 RepID=UPI0021A84714|nr:polyprenyl synthetase family protein [Sphingobacterium daejeonense]MCT1529393.1 polyprenyl synthetase family protein [Sphingobacterium daejeonense]
MFEKNPYGKLIAEYIQNTEYPKQPADLYDPIKYILSLSGKRIRPVLVLMGAKLFGKENLQEVVPASIAIEYFHNFSLIHDDIMDRAPLRRGKATVHQKWNDNVAILSGDALLVKAYQELGKSPSAHIPDLLSVFNKVALEVCEGQQYDMDFEKKSNVSEDDYLNMIKLKTSVLLGGALQMGAILANADQQQQELIYDFGVNLGISFQLQDDYLDVYGNPETFGKQVGGDILCNKKTILRIKTEQLLDEESKEEFQKLIDLDTIEDADKVSRMKNLYAKFEVDKYAEDIKSRYMELAYNKLDSIAVSEAQKAELRMLADTLMHRTR